MLVTWRSTAATVTISWSAIPWFDRPSAISDTTSRSRGVRSSSGLSWRRRPTIRCTTSGSSAEPPAATRWTASRKTVRSPTRSLSRYPTPAARLADEVERVACLEELGQHEDADVGQLLADLLGRPDPVVGRVGRHLDVRHHQIGLVRPRLAEQVGRVGRDGDHLVAAVLEHADDPL